jgi:ArsR family transcriptional regulator, arsenate/arsenite/antimonite-responsive transcriptional repressor
MRSSQASPIRFARALADETRQAILTACCCKWLSVNEIVDQTDVSQPTVSHHLAVLREAGLVDVRPDGKQTFYTVNQNRVALCCGALLETFAPETKATEAVKDLKG